MLPRQLRRLELLGGAPEVRLSRRQAGDKAARQILGEASADSALDFRPPPAVPLFNGKPWFMPAVFGWLSIQDKLAQWRRSTPSSKSGR